MAILLFLIVLAVLVLVHEWGHFIVAKRTGMRVDEFGIGFPPKLTSIKKGETEYSLNLLPIGGFVRIYGENAADAAADAAASADISRSFIAKNKWSQAAVLIAGVTMNILFAWLLFAVIFMVGAPTAVDEADAGAAAQLVIAEVLPDSPAAEAGLSPGAVITELKADNETLANLTPSSFSSFTQQHEELTLTYTLGEETMSTSLTPHAGIIDSQPEQPAVGVSLAMVETIKQPFGTAVKNATVTTGASLKAIAVGLASLIADSVRGQADLSQVAGPVGMVGLVGDAANFGITSLLMFTAIISLNLAIINLLPFPALDGGRLLFVAIEAVIRRPINPVWVARLNGLGFILLIGLMVAITFSDVSKLF